MVAPQSSPKEKNIWFIVIPHSSQKSHGATGQLNMPEKRFTEPARVRVTAVRHKLLKIKIRGTSLPLVEFFFLEVLGSNQLPYRISKGNAV
jgi:hypothetical protein